MKTDLKRAWVNNLRSGEFKQGTHVLRTEDDYYCCLGVLCKTAIGMGYPILETPQEGCPYMYGPVVRVENDDGSIGILSDAVRDVVDIFNCDCAELVAQNDTGVPFTTIAIWIDEHVEEDSGE